MRINIWVDTNSSRESNFCDEPSWTSGMKHKTSKKQLANLSDKNLIEIGRIKQDKLRSRISSYSGKLAIKLLMSESDG